MDKVIEKIADFAVNTEYDDLPDDVAHEMKRFILDVSGCAVLGLSTDRGRAVTTVGRRLGGPGESTIIGTSDKVACANAAFINGDMAYAMDFNAISNAGVKDPTMIVPATLALAESGGATGKDLMTATAVAFAAAYVLGSKNLPREGDGSPRPVGGYGYVTIAVAAGAGKMLGLNQEKMAYAMGIAGGLCPPHIDKKFVNTSPITMLKYGSGGWGAHVGVTSALLAEAGYTGDTSLFEGDRGFWIYSGLGKRNIDAKVSNLGKKWEGYESRCKRYPNCGQLAMFVAPFVRIIEKHDIKPDDIDKVIRYGGQGDKLAVFRDNELKTPDDYCFNLPYLIACAAFRINTSHWHDPEVKQHPRIKEFMQRVEFDYGVDDSTSGQGKSRKRMIEVVAKGQTYREIQPGYEYLKTDEEITRKFTDNASTGLPADKVDRAAQTILALEKVQNVAQMMELLVP